MDLSKIAFCLSEDRLDCETGLRLAILSLHRHCPESHVRVYRPPFNDAFRVWTKQFKNVHLVESAPTGASTWNCKPQALEPLLQSGFARAVWLDSDVIVTRDFRERFLRCPPETLIVTQEPASLARQGSELRTRGWGLKIGRSYPCTLNSSVVAVTSCHEALLHRWADLMLNEDYVKAQKLPLLERPLHLMSDQDLLNALLGSSEFELTPIHILRSGVDIIHAGGALGYSVTERLGGIARVKPTFLHATAGKPWLWLGTGAMWRRRDFFGWHRRLLQETSPYVAEAKRYRSKVSEECSWMDNRTFTGVSLRITGLGHHALRGLPITLFATGMRYLSGKSVL